ncbi:hypothetical protein ACHAW6_000013 [Cyclotella cf. meneghiniana]
MTEPIHQTGKWKCIKGCKWADIDKKPGANWPKLVLGDEIDNHFIGKAIRSNETMKQAVDGVNFFIHCQ